MTALFSAPTPAARLPPPVVPGIRTASESPAFAFCIRRTSTRPGWQSENGRRRSVFSFVCRPAALALDSIDDLAYERFGRGVDQGVDIGWRTVNRQPVDRLDAP